MSEIDLSVSIGNITFKNPLITASSDLTRNFDTFVRLVDLGVGGIISKSVTDIVQLQDGQITRFKVFDKNEKNYIFLTRGGAMITLDEWQKDIIKRINYAHEKSTVFIGSICVSIENNWAKYAKVMSETGVDMLELNFGNPFGGVADRPAGYLLGQVTDLGERIIKSIRAVTDKPIMVKVTPQVADIVPVAQKLQEAGATMIHFMHRFHGLAIDIENSEPYLGGIAGVGGPWMKPITLGWIYKAFAKKVGPICGGNGVGSWEDVIEFLMAGASLVQIASALFIKGPNYLTDILNGINEFCLRKGYPRVSELIGVIESKVVPVKELNRIPSRKAKINQSLCRECNDKSCLRYCFFNSLTIDKGEVYISDTCVGCGLCEQNCNVKGAIEMV